MAKRKHATARPRQPTRAQPNTGGASAGAEKAATAARGRRPRRRRRHALPLPWIAGLAGLALLAALQFVLNAVSEARLPGERYASQGNVHVALGSTTPPYNSDPPTSGWHTAELAPWGSHLEPQPDQRLVHNMEDGGVILWYALGTPEENARHVAALEEVASGYRRTVVVPREGMPTTYALTAWRRLQRFDGVDTEGMRAFIEAYHGLDHHR